MSVIVENNRGKSCSLYWKYNKIFLCSLGIEDAKYLINQLQQFIKEKENTWKRQK